MKKFEEPTMVIIHISEIVTFDEISSVDDETVIGGGGFGPIIG